MNSHKEPLIANELPSAANEKAPPRELMEDKNCTAKVSTVGEILCGGVCTVAGVGAGLALTGGSLVSLAGAALCIPGIACGRYFFKQCDPEPKKDNIQKKKNCIGFKKL